MAQRHSTRLQDPPKVSLEGSLLGGVRRQEGKLVVLSVCVCVRLVLLTQLFSESFFSELQMALSQNLVAYDLNQTNLQSLDPVDVMKDSLKKSLNDYRKI